MKLWSLYKRMIASISLLLAGNAMVSGQQLPLYSLTYENAFYQNPAITGAQPEMQAYAGYRRQWLNIDQAPNTALLGFNMPMEIKNIGIGAMLINDQTGPTAFTSLTVTYAYHIKFKKINPFKYPRFLKNSTISLGMAGSLGYYRLNADELRLENPDDEAVIRNNDFAFAPDAAAGIFYYYSSFRIGFSTNQLIPLTVTFKDAGFNTGIYRQPHYNLHADARIQWHSVQFYPVLWIRKTRNAPMQWEGLLKVSWQDVISLGMGYRSSGTVFAALGLKIAHKIVMAYAFDYNYSNTGSYLGSSHEIGIGYHFLRKGTNP